MCIIYKIGPKTNPCGTPNTPQSSQIQYHLLTLASFRYLRNDHIHLADFLQSHMPLLDHAMANDEDLLGGLVKQDYINSHDNTLDHQCIVPAEQQNSNTLSHDGIHHNTECAPSQLAINANEAITAAWNVLEKAAKEKLHVYRPGSLWIDEFKLNQIIQQRDNSTFAELLCRMRTNNHTPEDIRMLKSRVIEADSPNYPTNALHVYSLNDYANDRKQVYVKHISFRK